MLSQAGASVAPPRSVPPFIVAAPVADADRAELRAELEALNAQLRSLSSVDYGVKAYVGGWVTTMSSIVAGKMLWDWQYAPDRMPTMAIPFGLLAIVAGLKVAGFRRTQRRLAAAEELKLARQKELRKLLGVDEFQIPERRDHLRLVDAA